MGIGFSASFARGAFTVPTADYGTYPNIIDLDLDNQTFVFPANFNPVGLGSATPQDFADSLAAEVNNIFTTIFGAGNFTPITCTHSSDGLLETFTFNNFNTLKKAVFSNGSVAMNGSFDRRAIQLNTVWTVGILYSFGQTACLDRLLNCPRNYTHEISYRGGEQ